MQTTGDEVDTGSRVDQPEMQFSGVNDLRSEIRTLGIWAVTTLTCKTMCT